MAPRAGSFGAGRLALALGGGAIFVLSLAAGVWTFAVAFAVDAGRWETAAGVRAAAFDILLFSVFALHHSIFARRPVREWITRHVATGLERTCYVWIASALFILVCALWRPVPGRLWLVDWPWSIAMIGAQVAGLAITLHASKQLDVFSLSGMRQALDRPARTPTAIVSRGWYALVRHPIYFAWVLMVWPTPEMTGSRLVFAAISTFYLAIAVPFEERSLRREFGEAYDAYCRQVRWKMVPFLY